MKLEKKTILITGGTSGIGRALVERFQGKNDLIVLSRPSTRLDQLAADFPDIETIGADLSQQQKIDRACDEILLHHERLDLIIHNAALQQTELFPSPEFRYSEIAKEITLNFTAICCLTARLLPLLRHEQEAAILHVNSALGLAPKTGSAVYCATKAALNSLTYSLRYQLAATNIVVLQCFLPLVDTGMTAGRGSGKWSASAAADGILEGVANEIPDHALGKAALLRRILRISPALARRIMRNG